MTSSPAGSSAVPHAVTTSRASIYGGQHSAADAGEFAKIVAQLSLASRSLRQCGSQWEEAAQRTEIGYQSILNCVVLDAEPGGIKVAAHEPSYRDRLPLVTTRSKDISTRFSEISTRYGALSDLVARAHSMYSVADNTVSGIITSAIGTIESQHPILAFLGAGVLVASAWAAGGGSKEGGFLINASEPLQEGIFRGLGRILSGGGGSGGSLGLGSLGLGSLADSASDHPVNDAARKVATISSFLSTLFFGNQLVVSEPTPEVEPIGASATVSDALRNLDALRESPTGVPYGTVAVQKYVDNAGTSRWLILIPGTTTHTDTAIGWGQNIELMSSDNTQRMNADSARLVVEAMKRSGIGADDPVTLVGHSQGGIVAATVASGLSRDYNITHIVTAGSPIANHPIPADTWVTSIENEGEGVSNIDGARNPDRPTWLTVRGEITSADASRRDGTAGVLSGAEAGTKVEGAPKHTDITHAMNYQRATWKDAQGLGSQALEEHDEHFSEQVRGRLESSQYYTGRMTR